MIPPVLLPTFSPHFTYILHASISILSKNLSPWVSLLFRVDVVYLHVTDTWIRGNGFLRNTNTTFLRPNYRNLNQPSQGFSDSIYHAQCSGWWVHTFYI